MVETTQEVRVTVVGSSNNSALAYKLVDSVRRTRGVELQVTVVGTVATVVGMVPDSQWQTVHSYMHGYVMGANAEQELLIANVW